MQDWRVDAGESTVLEEAADTIVRWCIEAMAATRRPFGVDHFDLAIAFGTSPAPRTLRFTQLRVARLYDGYLTGRLLEALRHCFAGGEAVSLAVSAGLFSWGDALHAALQTHSSAQ